MIENFIYLCCLFIKKCIRNYTEYNKGKDYVMHHTIGADRRIYV